jgi:predicted lipoprotein with Yx(FWY)xxD motif
MEHTMMGQQLVGGRARPRPSRRSLAVVGVLAASSMLAAACGSSSSTASSPTTTAKSTTTTTTASSSMSSSTSTTMTSSTSTTMTSSNATVDAASSAYGKILVDAKGYTLYLLSSEAGGMVKCQGGCLKIWLPVTLPSGMSKPVAGSGVQGTLGVITRSDGTKQVTDNGYPLYTFVRDTKPGETNGEGIKFPAGGVWYVVSATATSPSATAVTAKMGSSSSSSSGMSYSTGY